MILEQLPHNVIERILNETLDEHHLPDPDKMIPLLKESGFAHLVNDALVNCVDEIYELWEQREEERLLASN
jgi:hypothetical protein